MNDGVEPAEYFLNFSNPPDAILAAIDVMAVGCLSRLVEKGILIPDDMAIFGFDNISIAKDSNRA